MTCCLAGCAVPSLEEDWVRVTVDPDLPALPCRHGGTTVGHGDEVVVETVDGPFLGRVTLFAPPVLRPPRQLAGKIVRLADDDDRRQHEAVGGIEEEMTRALRRRIHTLDLDMRPLKVRVPLSGRKAMVYFTAEQRVDYRRLVRELAKSFRRRIEMRAIGVRDGARIIGGLGPCGCSLCCSTFMGRFHSVTVRMAKRQNLSLNPAKISGMCGRLMCCLSHEVEQYPSRNRKS
jgi:cell fate regulator YaaT (PSP1 superfamily)